MNDWPIMDESLRSPSGRMSKRARKEALKRESELWDKYMRKKYPDLTPEEKEKKELSDKKEKLQRESAYFREWAGRGVQPRKMIKMAEKAESELANL